jgi:tetratricopeptide (TPR) repeat protein
VFGWTRYMLGGRHWIVPILFALFAETAGLGGMRWVEGYIGRLARQGDPRAGEAAVLAYDCLRRRGRDADAWLDRMTPGLTNGGPAVLGETFDALRQQGYRSIAMPFLRRSLGHGQFAEELTPRVANNYAWQLLSDGGASEALPYARAAAAAVPENPNHLGTYGETLLSLGEAEMAAEYFRRSLALRERAGTRFALARALVAQGLTAEALTEGEAALPNLEGQWDKPEPSPDQARAYLDEWRNVAEAVRL